MRRRHLLQVGVVVGTAGGTGVVREQTGVRACRSVTPPSPACPQGALQSSYLPPPPRTPLSTQGINFKRFSLFTFCLYITYSYLYFPSISHPNDELELILVTVHTYIDAGGGRVSLPAGKGGTGGAGVPGVTGPRYIWQHCTLPRPPPVHQMQVSTRGEILVGKGLLLP